MFFSVINFQLIIPEPKAYVWDPNVIMGNHTCEPTISRSIGGFPTEIKTKTKYLIMITTE